jgi:hypothetical protein
MHIESTAGVFNLFRARPTLANTSCLASRYVQIILKVIQYKL